MHAVLDDGSTLAATRVAAPELAVDYFIAWAPAPRAIRRIVALDDQGAQLAIANRPLPPPEATNP